MDATFYLSGRYKKAIAAIFKVMLKTVEDMRQDHQFHYAKLYENIPEEYHPIIKAADHFDDQKAAWIRKRILDVGNESLRDFFSDLEHYEVSFVFKNSQENTKE